MNREEEKVRQWAATYVVINAVYAAAIFSTYCRCSGVYKSISSYNDYDWFSMMKRLTTMNDNDFRYLLPMGKDAFFKLDRILGQISYLKDTSYYNVEEQEARM